MGALLGVISASESAGDRLACDADRSMYVMRAMHAPNQYCVTSLTWPCGGF